MSRTPAELKLVYRIVGHAAHLPEHSQRKGPFHPQFPQPPTIYPYALTHIGIIHRQNLDKKSISIYNERSSDKEVVAAELPLLGLEAQEVVAPMAEARVVPVLPRRGL